jgi:hypothetical protein
VSLELTLSTCFFHYKQPFYSPSNAPLYNSPPYVKSHQYLINLNINKHLTSETSCMCQTTHLTSAHGPSEGESSCKGLFLKRLKKSRAILQIIHGSSPKSLKAHLNFGPNRRGRMREMRKFGPSTSSLHGLAINSHGLSKGYFCCSEVTFGYILLTKSSCFDHHSTILIFRLLCMQSPNKIVQNFTRLTHL